jgi:tetratricopeptide (TPR) repeat protein
MQLKIKKPYIFLIKLIFSCVFVLILNQKSFAAEDTVSTVEAVDQIQKTLLFSNKEAAEKLSSQRKVVAIDRTSKDDGSDIKILVLDPKAESANDQKQKLAYNSALAGQYEVAVELYKQVIKSDPKNNYAKFALASSYHMLGQYKQAKNLYYQLLKNNWDDEKTKNELIGNLISVIVEESPNDAVYILAKLSNENPSSAYILAGAAMAYDKIKQTDQAILLLKRAINIDPKEVKYQFNLAILYDKSEDYQNALKCYQDVIKNYVSSQDIDNSIPIVQVKQRIEFIKNKI